MTTTEGDYDRADQDVNRDESRVEGIPGDVGRDVTQNFDSGVQDVKDAPSDLGKDVSSAASWVGDKFGGVEGDGRRADQDVNNFDQGVDNSFNQGQQQGEQQGF